MPARKTDAALRVCLFLCCAAAAFGQGSSSSLHGAVTDPSGAVVAGASVVLTNANTNSSRTGVTAQDGVYQFSDVPPGAYSISVTAAGFKSAKVSNLELLVNTPATANVVLQIGTQGEIVDVAADLPTINTQDATLGTAFQEHQVKQLPIESRNVVDLLTLQPGVVYLGNRTDIDTTQDTRSGSVNGARSDQTSVTLDGVDVTDQARGLAFTSVLRTTPDALQEFRVTTSNPTAAEGNSSGAQVALVTKSGTNTFHGSFYEYLRNTATSANDYFIKQAQIQSGQPNKAPKLNRNLFGVSYGGPIVRNRLFIFANYEGRRDRQEQSVVTTVPTATLRAGSILYENANGGVTTVNATDLAQWDPLKIGPNDVMLQYFQGFPLPNDQSVGDGLNFSGYRFAAPSSARYDVYTARLDYRLDSKGNHNIFWRGSLQNDYVNGVPYLPGAVPMKVDANRGKGFALGYTAVLKLNLVNDFRWGFTRASVGSIGNSQEPFLAMNEISGGITRNDAVTVPVHNFSDNMSWNKGRHTLQFGTAIQLIHDQTNSLATSFSQARLSTTYINTGGFATTGSPFDPAANGFPDVSRNFTTGYDEAAFDVLGMITNVVANYNYDRAGNILPQGTPIRRDYSLKQYDFYFQDSFRLRPNLTLNLGLRYQLESPPYEVNGLQVSSSFPLGKWLQLRESNMFKGIPSNQDPPIEYVLGGKANRGPDFYRWDKNNFAPRISIAYSPTPTSGWLNSLFGQGKTSIRAGFAVAYDHFGAELINTFASSGSFGLSTSLVTPLASQSVDCAPRVTSLTAVPVNGCPNQNNGFIMLPAPPGGFPQTPPIGAENGGFSNGFTIDQGITTPYVYMLNFSVAREFARNSSIELSYLGRLSHRLLSQQDLAQPLNLKDPSTGVDYFSAMSRLSTLARQNVAVSDITPTLVGPTAEYWDQFPGVAQSTNVSDACPAGACTPLQAIYSLEQIYLYNETFIPYFLDIPGFFDGCPNGCGPQGPYVFYDPQFYALYAWRSLGNANYHALQASFRQRLWHGMQFDLNYTYSKSLDLTSAAARVGANGGGPQGGAVGGQIINTFSPRQMYAVSDYDMTHQFNANWVIELPFGRGKGVASNASGWKEALIGGWQFSGLLRMTSGLPFSVSNGINLPTNGANGGLSTQVSPVKAGAATKVNGKVLMFSDPAAAFNAFLFTYPGQSGSRNTLRGDGFLGWDSSLSKRWIMPYNEHHSLQFRWEVFNVGNFSRFNVNSNTPVLTNSTNFGNYTGLLTNPRVMQFALRYEF